jgi:1-acyl-sn-glycerol-3-phosphate acyltransferase
MYKQEDWLDQPTRFSIGDVMPRYWPPCPNRFWSICLRPLQGYLARTRWQIAEVVVERIESLAGFDPQDGVLIAPNHSHEGDAHVLCEVARRTGRRFYFMAAWEAFARHRGIDGWLLQRLGAFSVDREGCDRRALRQAIDLLSAGQWLVVFPEGEIHHLNERLKPLLEGVAFIVLTTQHRLEAAGSPARVWVVPAAIRYRFVGDVRPQLEAAIARLEKRLFWWKPPRDAPLHDRIVRFGEALLTLKEKEKLGRSREADGTLSERVSHLIEVLLRRHESAYQVKYPPDATVPLRVKALRRRLLDHWTDATADAQRRRAARDALDDVELVLQLYSYPGDYVTENPTPERMAETVEKFEEDVYGRARSLAPRRARILFGERMAIQQPGGTGRSPALLTGVTDRLEHTIQELMAAVATES